MVVHQLFESLQRERQAHTLRDDSAKRPTWIERPSWVWLVGLIVRLCCLLSSLILALATAIALLIYLLGLKPAARQRCRSLAMTLVHTLVGILLPNLGLALLLGAPGWARSALRATALSALLMDRK